MRDLLSYTVSRVTPDNAPPGRYVDLPGRGAVFVCDVPGPPGAPTLLLIHGLAVNGYLNWFPAFSRLSRHFRVVTMDLRGHGRSMPLKGRFRLADCADDAVALADQLGIDKLVPVGYSLGGPVAQLVWHRHPDRVAGLVLAATSRNFGGTPQERWFYSSLLGAIWGLRLTRHLPFVGGRAEEKAIEALLPYDPGDEWLAPWAIGELRRTRPAVVLQAMSAMGRFSSHNWIGSIDVPAAVVVTVRDRLISPARQINLARALSDVTIHPTHAGHAACVLGARRFVPALVEACLSVASRVDSWERTPDPA